MKTEKPVSTISYNSTEFLETTLDSLRSAGIIEEWCYIRHKPDSDGTKFHNHVYMLPAKKIDTDELRPMFTEATDGLPLGCMPIVSSEFSNWLLYGIHDAKFLAKKGLCRNFHYALEDVVRSSDEWFNMCMADMPHDRNEVIYTLLRDGYTPTDLLRDGIIKLSDYQNCKRAYDDIQSEKEQEFRFQAYHNYIYITDSNGVTYRVNRQRLNHIRLDMNETIYMIDELGEMCSEEKIVFVG